MGQGLAARVVFMYVHHAFGMQLILGKDRSYQVSGKDRLGFRNACHFACGTDRLGNLEDVLLY